MTDNVELKQKYIRIFTDLQSIFGPLIDEDRVTHGVPGRYSPGGPPPVPWRQGVMVAQTMGEALVRAAQMKVAAKMAGNDELAGAADERIGSILDDDWCPMYARVIKLPPKPWDWKEPPPRPEEIGVNWQGLEILVSTVMDYHVSLPDGALKDELGGIVMQIGAPG